MLNFGRLVDDLVYKQANDDEQLILLWLHGKAIATQSAYRSESDRFRAAIAKPLRAVTLADCTHYLESRRNNATATQARAVNVLKSLFRFAVEIGYLPYNPAKPLKSPPIKNALAERILSESDIKLIIQGEEDPHHRAALLLLYGGALRISELCGLRWRDCRARGDTAQITVFGKGGKTGVVLLPTWAWTAIEAIAPNPRPPDSFVFPGEHGQLHRSTAWRWVKSASKRVGLEQASAHWFRHAHASHSLDGGATIALVQATLRHSSIATTSKYLHVRPNESSGKFLAL